jgi:hypothetical protein
MFFFTAKCDDVSHQVLQEMQKQTHMLQQMAENAEKQNLVLQNIGASLGTIASSIKTLAEQLSVQVE